jgi:hypothetical protein
MAISLTGDGCRYCQPQEYIDRIHEQTDDNSKDSELLEARVSELYDLIKYAQVDSGVCMCGDDIKDHNQSSGHMPCGVVVTDYVAARPWKQHTFAGAGPGDCDPPANTEQL